MAEKFKSTQCVWSLNNKIIKLIQQNEIKIKQSKQIIRTTKFWKTGRKFRILDFFSEKKLTAILEKMARCLTFQVA